MLSNRDKFVNKCFSMDWAEVVDVKPEPVVVRKDLDTLMAELEEIKENIQQVSAKQWRLANLMRFYTGDGLT